MMSTAWWPSSWKSRSFRKGTVCPRCTSMPVGSMPYLTRSGLPVLKLRSSFWRSSASGTICSAPRLIKASCSSTDFTACPTRFFEPRLNKENSHFRNASISTEHLETSSNLEGVAIVFDGRLGLIGGPRNRTDIEAGHPMGQPVPLQEVEGQLAETPLLGTIDGRGRLEQIAGFRRADLDENDTAPVERNQVKFTKRAGVVACDNPEALAFEKPSRGTLGSAAEPAS